MVGAAEAVEEEEAVAVEEEEGGVGIGKGSCSAGGGARGIEEGEKAGGEGLAVGDFFCCSHITHNTICK